MDRFTSSFEARGHVDLPQFHGIRVMMMPLVLGDQATVPSSLNCWRDTLDGLFGMCAKDRGSVGYLTIDEKIVRAGSTHRRRGLHVDGVYRGGTGAWGGGGPGGPWGAPGSGMLTVASVAACRAWRGEFDGLPGREGECDHLAAQCQPGQGTVFEAGEVYWLDGLCIHESIPTVADTPRQFVRLSLPSCAPWFEGYTENPLGVMPSGPILPRREFMDA